MRDRFIIWSIACLLLLCVASCEGQSKTKPAAAQVTAERPLLVKTQGSRKSEPINNSFRDDEGNLWFGSISEGMYKYDGHSFRQYTESDGLSSNTVWSILQDNDGRIWIGTAGGLNYLEHEKIVALKIEVKGEPKYKKSEVMNLLQDRNGLLWFATINGIYTYDGNSFTPFVIKEEGPGYRSDRHNVEYMLEDASGNIWFGGRMNQGVYRYDGDNIRQFKLSPLEGHDWAWPKLQDSNGDIWFTNWGGVYRFDGSDFSNFTMADGLCSKAITSVIEDKYGTIWIGGGEGICRYDGSSFTHLNEKDGLTNTSVWEIVEDRNGHLWIGTRNNELFRFDGKEFLPYTKETTSLPQLH